MPAVRSAGGAESSIESSCEGSCRVEALPLRTFSRCRERSMVAFTEDVAPLSASSHVLAICIANPSQATVRVCWSMTYY